VLERAVISSSGPKLRLVDELKVPQKDLSTPLKTMEGVEYDHIVQVLELIDWKVSGKDGAAEILGLKRGTLRARMQKLGIHFISLSRFPDHIRCEKEHTGYRI